MASPSLPPGPPQNVVTHACAEPFEAIDGLRSGLYNKRTFRADEHPMERAQAFLVWLLPLSWAAFQKGSAMTKKPFHTGSAIALWLLTAVLVPMALANDPIDWQRAGELRRREQQGQTLNQEERAYLERAKQQRRLQDASRRTAAGPEKPRGWSHSRKWGTGLYKEQTGGLYGHGQNIPPESHLKAAQEQAALIVPRDAQGNPSDGGKIVLISLGMSNTTQEFSVFKTLADADPNKSPKVVIVDCAQGGRRPTNGPIPKSSSTDRPSPWDVMDQRIKAAGVTASQIQVVWLKQAQMGPAQLGEFPAHAQSLRDDVAIILRQLRTRFPEPAPRVPVQPDLRGLCRDAAEPGAVCLRVGVFRPLADRSADHERSEPELSTPRRAKSKRRCCCGVRTCGPTGSSRDRVTA